MAPMSVVQEAGSSSGGGRCRGLKVVKSCFYGALRSYWLLQILLLYDVSFSESTAKNRTADISASGIAMVTWPRPWVFQMHNFKRFSSAVIPNVVRSTIGLLRDNYAFCWNSFALALSGKFTQKRSLKIAQHFELVATWPCELWLLITIVRKLAWMSVHHHAERYKLAGDLICGRRQQTQATGYNRLKIGQYSAKKWTKGMIMMSLFWLTLYIPIIMYIRQQAVISPA